MRKAKVLAIVLSFFSLDQVRLEECAANARRNNPNASQWYLQFKDDGLKERCNQVKFEQFFNKIRILRINVIALTVFITAT